MFSGVWFELRRAKGCNLLCSPLISVSVSLDERRSLKLTQLLPCLFQSNITSERAVYTVQTDKKVIENKVSFNQCKIRIKKKITLVSVSTPRTSVLIQLFLNTDSITLRAQHCIALLLWIGRTFYWLIFDSVGSSTDYRVVGFGCQLLLQHAGSGSGRANTLHAMALMPPWCV